MAKPKQVYIIESRSADDHWDNRHEGRSLQEVLRMEGVDSSYREVISVGYLERALKEASRPSTRYVHFSCHGDEDGIVLTDGTELSWRQFDRLAWPHLKDVVLVFSACSVGAGVAELFTRHKTFCRAIIAPKKVIYWPEGLAAFTAFYHLAMSTDTTAEEDIRVMNRIVRSRPFLVHFPPRGGQTLVLG